MTGPLLLAGVALALAAVGHWWLPRTKWPHRAPMLGIVAWQTLTASLAFTVFLVGVNLALPGLSAVSTLGELARACTVELSRQYSTPEGALTSTVGLMLAATVSLRCLVALVHEVRATSSLRRAHRVALAAVGARLTEITSRVTGGAAEDVLLIDSPEAAVFCIPGGGWPARGRGRSATIVMTRGATLALNASELELVLVHERAHLRARHDRVVVVAHALARAFSWLPVFSVAAKQISCLAEMHADDAVARAERPGLAAALCRLSLARSDGLTATMAAAGGDVVARAERLVGRDGPLGRLAAGTVIAAVLTFVAAPAVAATVPEGAGLSHHCCPSRP